MLYITKKFLKVALDITWKFKTYDRYSWLSDKEHIAVHRTFFYNLRCTDFE